MRNNLDEFVPEVQTARPNGGRPLSPAVIEARISVRIAELEVLAAQAAVEYWRARIAARDEPPMF
jgi:hypothetical protein